MTKIGIIGYGNMGSCLAEKLKSKYEVYIFDKDKNKIADSLEIKIAENNADLVDNADVVILAVKPQDFDSVLSEIKNEIKEKLVISIAAGITTNHIEKYSGKVRIIRAMPNMPARIGKGMTCICRGKFASEQDLNFAKELFNNLGKTLILNEEMMSAATAISGSGPGYFFDLVQNKKIDINNQEQIEKFNKELLYSAKNMGFNAQDAMILADTTTFGSIILLKTSNLSAEELKKQITSKAGTTEAGLEILHKGGSLEEAVEAAKKRAEELSKRQ